jgi:geranylgeranyl reductase family protein
VERFDAIVVGAGPAGSTTAYRLARAGARVILVDRARFPRDKPCGGGVTIRAVRLLPFALDPVVEDVVESTELRFRFGKSIVRGGRVPLVYMTQRSRLDHFLVEKAVEAGAELREGVKVTAIEAGREEVVIEAGGERIVGQLVIGADGVNGISAKTLGLGGYRTIGVAVEGNVPYGLVDKERYRGRAVIEFGTIPGGYGWVFPKADHVNIGVGGWGGEAPNLRAELRRICDAHGVEPSDLQNFRGFRLPLRESGAVMARGRAALVGDAAGLIDPVTGDGMFEAFLSSEYVAEAALDVLAGRADGLEPYSRRLVERLATHTWTSWSVKAALDRFPRTAFLLAGTLPVSRAVERLVRGEVSDVTAIRGLARAPLKVLALLARAAGDPGAGYRAERSAAG